MIIHVKHLEQCLAQSKCSVSVIFTIHPNPDLQAQTTMTNNCQHFFFWKCTELPILSSALRCQNSHNDKVISII